MKRAKEILCPYCCNRFSTNEVHFRLKKPLLRENKAKQEVEKDTDIEFSLTIPNFTKTSQDKNILEKSNDGRVRDELLYNYYIDYLNDKAGAEREALQLPSVAFDTMNTEIKFNIKEYNEYGYVNNIIYKNQELDERLCPKCHNKLVDGAGKYEMIMISLIGDTNVGKTVYLRILEEIISEGPFGATLFFMGTKEEHNYYLNGRNKLIQDGMMVDATIGKVPPLTFQLTYNDPESNDRDSIFITFCDIAGEKCRDNQSLREYGKHLRASSGIMFLIDPTRFHKIKNSIGHKGMLDNMYQEDILTAINRFLISGTYDSKSKIPTAVLLTKSDTLKGLEYFTQSEEHKMLVNDIDWMNRHPGYLNEDEIQSINKGVWKFLEAMDEKNFVRKVQDLFVKYGFFINSALGKAPTKEEEESGAMTVRGNISPYRVTEAFYWILAESDLIPRKLTRIYKNRKSGAEKSVFVYYRTSEVMLSVNNRIEAAKLNAGIKDSLFSKWDLIKELH